MSLVADVHPVHPGLGGFPEAGVVGYLCWNQALELHRLFSINDWFESVL
jgi:hypothetical protein